MLPLAFTGTTVHPVNAALLAQGSGRYRCGKCNKTSNALEHLFDDWPAAGDKPAGAGDLPVLGLNIDFTKAGRSRLEPAEAALTGAGAFACVGGSQKCNGKSADFTSRPAVISDSASQLAGSGSIIAARASMSRVP